MYPISATTTTTAAAAATCITTTSTNTDATVAFNLPFDSLSSHYHNQMWLLARANPIRLGRVPALYLFLDLSLFFPPLSPSPFFASVFLFLSFVFPSFFFIPGPSWPLWLCFSRENLSQGKDSLSKGVVIGSPGRFDLLTPRPFSHTRRHRCQLNNVSNVSFLTNSNAVRNSRKVSMENWLDRAISCRGVKYILTYYLKNRVNILGYFFEYQQYRYQIS